jgi:hypothetical protein
MAQGNNMATADQQGIMALPAGGPPADTSAPAQSELTLNDSYDAVQQGLQNASPDAHAAVNAEIANIVPQLDSLSDEELDELLQIIQFLYDNPDKYAQTLAQLIADGSIEAGDLPEEHDPEFLATFGMVLMQAKKSRQASQQSAPIQQAPVPPMGMARGGIAEAARMVASQGRGTDTVLAHINPQEAALLRKRGGMGVINPETGLPEYGLFKKIGRAIKNVVKSVATVVKQVISSPIGKVVATVALATFVGPAAFGLSGATGVAAQMAIASGGVTALGGGSVKDVLKSAAIGGATAFFGAPGGAVSNFVGGAVTNAAANAAITSGIVGTGIGLLSGEKLQDAMKNGLTAGAVSGLTTGFTKGFGTSIDAPKVDSVAEMAKNQQGANVSGKSDTWGQQPASSTSSDPLGDFIQQNEATRNAANTPAVPKPLSPPSAMDSLQTMGGGVMDLAQGNFQQGYDSLTKGAGDLFMPSTPSPTAVVQSPEYNALVLKGIPADAAYKTVLEQSAPGIIRTYAPAVIAGLGVAGAAGAFDQKPAQPTPQEEAMNQRLADESARVAANPGNYVPQGLERFGIEYNERGEIIGSNPYNPAPAAGSTEVTSAPLVPYTPNFYTPDSGALGGNQPVAQPYNTANMYTNLRPPLGYNSGGEITPMNQGIASLASGGYPRRTGQISGPGTETSDSIPAMLSDGEFVMTAKAVKGAGKGSRLAGAKKMYALMHQLERNAARG